MSDIISRELALSIMNTLGQIHNWLHNDAKFSKSNSNIRAVASMVNAIRMRIKDAHMIDSSTTVTREPNVNEVKEEVKEEVSQDNIG